jgi:cyanophycin synthetase
MITKLDFTGLKFFAGCHAGVAEKTARVDARWMGSLPPLADLEHERRWADRLAALRPNDPLWGLSAQGFPADCLAPASAPAVGVFPTWLLALTVALQRWARQPVWQGAVLGAQANACQLALPYAHQQVCTQALQHAAQLLMAWSLGPERQTETAQAERAVHDWLGQVQRLGLVPSTLRFFAAARARSMHTASRLDHLQIGQGCHAQWLDSSFTGATSGLAIRTARSKRLTNRLLAGAGVPVPAQVVAPSLEAAEAAAQQLGWPVVIKPGNQDQGMGVVPSIRDLAALRLAFAAADRFGPGQVLVERHIEGADHRVLVVGGRVRAVALRVAGGVVGDGVRSVAALLAQLNADPRRGIDKRSLLIRIELDAQALSCLAEQGLTPDRVPAAGRVVALRRTANISTGGTSHDVTAMIHPDNRALAERAARLVGLDVAGVDLLCPDIGRSWREVGAGICEVNAQPGLRAHWLAAPAHDINGEIIDWLFQGRPSRIPTAAITGTNGKSTVARMLHHIWRSTGALAGVCTTQGVWVGDELVSTDNLSGHPGAQLLLNDPAVQAAVFEMPRKGLLVFGHPCERYDVAALLNIQDDHIGVDGVNSRAQMAELKSQVLARAHDAVVINAEDPLCLAMRPRAPATRLVLVAREGSNASLQAHREAGGEAIFIAAVAGVRWAVWASGLAQTPLLPLGAIPATLNGLLPFNESNALFAMALARVQGLEWAAIVAAMGRFQNSPAHNPGRYNLIEGLPFQLLLDYSHNPDGVREVCRVASQLVVSGQRRLLAVEVGNRHVAHWPAVARDVAAAFDEVVVSCNPEFVQKSPDHAGDDPVAQMLGGAQKALLAAGLAPGALRVQADRQAALQDALASARAGDLLVVLADSWEVLPVLERLRQRFAGGLP